jgi:hypothetical protein
VNSIFGGSWGAPICEGAPPAPTPVGVPCLECGVLIKEGDQGVVRPVLRLGRAATMEPTHKECDLRNAVGPPAHLRGMFLTPQQRAKVPRAELCRCWGGNAPHPSHDTPEGRYAEACAVWDRFQEMHRRPPFPRTG